MLVDPKRAKKTVKLSSFFALLGSGSVKAAHRTLVKLNHGEVKFLKKPRALAKIKNIVLISGPRTTFWCGPPILSFNEMKKCMIFYQITSDMLILS